MTNARAPRRLALLALLFAALLACVVLSAWQRSDGHNPREAPAFVAHSDAPQISHDAVKLKSPEVGARSAERAITASFEAARPDSGALELPRGQPELLAQWRLEPNDEAWTAAERESVIAILLENELDTSIVKSVACGETLCRLVMHVSQTDNVAKLVPVLRHTDHELKVFDDDTAGAAIDHASASSTRRYVVYLSRPGEPL